MKENKEDIIHSLYYDPYKSNKHKFFFRIKLENIDKIWGLTNKQLMLLINIWIYNKEKNKYKLSNKELNTVDFVEEKFKICKSKSNISTHLKKIEKLELISINGPNKKRNFSYDFNEKSNNFRSIPLVKILHWLKVSDSEREFKTYIYLLFKFYNDNRGGNGAFGKRKVTISNSDLGEKLDLSAGTIGNHCRKIVGLGLLDVEKSSGKTNTYYLPYYSDGKKIYAAKTRSSEKIPGSFKTN